MADLRNEPSLSHSFLAMLETCPRRAMWHRFISWGGWARDAPAEARLAYRLKQQTGIYALIGQAVEEQCRRALATAQEGGALTVDDMVKGARARLAAAWHDHQSRGWMHDPKRRTCLQEAYYGDRMPEQHAVTKRIRDCCSNFLERVLPELAALPADRFLAVDPLEAIEVDGLRVYAVSDLAVSIAPEEVLVIDLKSGRRNAAVAEQLGLYALWAVTRWPGVSVVTRAEYLLEGERVEERWRAEDLGWVREWLARGRERYRGYLVDGDLARHEALPREAWPMTEDVRECRRCQFREACQPPALQQEKTA